MNLHCFRAVNPDNPRGGGGGIGGNSWGATRRCSTGIS